MVGLLIKGAIKFALKFLRKWRLEIGAAVLVLLTFLMGALAIKRIHQHIYNQGYADGIKATEISAVEALSVASEVAQSISEGYAAENSKAISALIESGKKQNQAIKDLQDETQTYLATPAAHDCALDADGVRLINKTLATSDRRPD